jgi:hypothetical protein
MTTKQLARQFFDQNLKLYDIQLKMSGQYSQGEIDEVLIAHLRLRTRPARRSYRTAIKRSKIR